MISFDWHFPYAIRAVHAMWNMYIHRHILYTFCAGFARHLDCVYHPCHTLNNYLHTFRMFYPITHDIPYTHVTRLFISSLSVIIRGVPKRPIEALYLCQKGTSRPITPLIELSTQREATRMTLTKLLLLVRKLVWFEMGSFKKVSCSTILIHHAYLVTHF